MAKKSKTQRAKASAARQAKKEAREFEDSQETKAVETVEETGESKSRSLFKRDKESADKPAKKAESDSKKEMKKAEDKPKKKHFQFFRDVKAEMKRVTWPTRSDVMRWTGVVAVALVFFGIFVAVLDNLIITPLLVLISGADPSSIDWLSAITGGGNVDASSASSAADMSSADISSSGSADASNVDMADNVSSGSESAGESNTSEGGND